MSYGDRSGNNREPSRAQKRTLAAAIEILESELEPPSLAQIAEKTGISRVTVKRDLDALEELGYVTRIGRHKTLSIQRDTEGAPYVARAHEAGDGTPEGPGAAAQEPGRVDPKHRPALDALSRAYYRVGGPVTAAQASRAMNTDTRVAQRRLQPLVDQGFAALEGGRYTVLRRADGSPALPGGAPPQDRAVLEAQRRLSEAMELLTRAGAGEGREITPVDLDEVELEVRGTIGAGPGVEALETRDELVRMPRLRAPFPDSFALRVRGRSMVRIGILPGDLAICRRVPDVDNGQVAAVLLPDGTATLKRVFKSKRAIELRPEAEDFEPIVLRENVTIQGKLIGIWRDYE